jgi:hypothetical protein
MTTQTEAQRLAEKLKSYSLRSGYAWHCHKAAAELLRLEAENARMRSELERPMSSEATVLVHDNARLRAEVQALREALAQPAAQPLDCLHINEGSTGEAALTYEAEYWAEMAQGKADADTRRGAVQRVGYYVRDAILRMQAQASQPLTAAEIEEADGDRGIPKDTP